MISTLARSVIASMAAVHVVRETLIPKRTEKGSSYGEREEDGGEI